MDVLRFCIATFALAAAGSGNLEVSFESKDAGYFLKSLQGDLVTDDKSFIRHVDRFTVLHPSQINMVKVAYGPFTAKQTVPAMPIIGGNQSRIQGMGLLDITAHVVTKEVRRDQPLLRVLFHLGIGSREVKLKAGVHGICVVLLAERDGERLTTTCIPNLRDGTCLAELTIPSHWWPPLDQARATKLRNVVHLEYAITEGDCPSMSPAFPTQPTTRLDDVNLSNAHGQYMELKQDEVVRILVPQGVVYPRSRVYVPVYMYPNPAYPVYVFVLRARVKTGLRILGAQASQPGKWSITMDTNSKQTVATVTAFIKETNTASPEELPQGSQEVFSWLFEVEENADTHDGGRIVWNLRYVLDSSRSEQYNFDDNNIKMTSQLDVRKDDIQAVLPIAKTWELVNTAVLNGKQVSQPMKLYIVSQAGKVADVTLQSSCQSVDESILKVTTSCTSVYLDGSEIRGSHNASIMVKYGNYLGYSQFTVWIPELPLDVQVADTKLSQIKWWRVPQNQRNIFRKMKRGITEGNRVRGNSGSPIADEDEEKSCHLRFQQSPVEVYARFFAVDDNSGRESYLLNRKAYFRITELVEGTLRVSDNRIASLKGRLVQGQSVGRTEIQVLSPITGRVMGNREVRIGNDKVTIDHLKVTVVTGLQLSIQPDDDFANVFVAQTSLTHKLTAQYQEGLLDIRLQFSDGTVTPLSHIADTDYHLVADTKNHNIIAFAPMIAQHNPRVIAISQGKGDLLQINLELAEACQRKRTTPLAMAQAYVDVDFINMQRQEEVQNDGGSDLNVKLNGKGRTERKQLTVAGYNNHNKATKHHSKDELTMQARQNPIHHPMELTSLEIGMYALLGIFCLAIIVFVISCAVYAVRYRRKQMPPGSGCESVTNAHDWVWLGRATLERNALSTRSSQTNVPMADMNGNQPSRAPRRDHPSSRPSSNRSSNISYPGSDTGIRITPNPHPPITDISIVPSPPPPPDSNDIVSLSANHSGGKHVRIQSNPLPPLSSPELKPIDGSATFTIVKPPVPPHANKPATGDMPPPPPVKSRGVRSQSSPPIIIQHCDKGVPCDAQWESVTMGMNYDQLMEYFDNLKESNA